MNSNEQTGGLYDGLEPTLDNLHLFTIGTKNQLARRKKLGVSGLRKTIRSIEAAFESVFLRPMQLEDINPDVAMMLVNRWKREGMSLDMLHRRHEWFRDRNATAVALGWSKSQDFSGINIGRSEAWQASRQAVPVPKPLKGSRTKSKTTMPLLDFLNEHYRPTRLVGKSINTVRLYRHSINAFSRWLGRAAVLGDLNNKTVSDFLYWSLENTELAAATVEKDRSQLCVLWTFAAKRGWLKEFPEINAIPCPKRVPDAWSDDEMVQLMEACESAPGRIGKVDANKYWPALVSFIYDTGERISATLALERQYLEADGWVTIRGEHRKGKTRDKRFRLRPITLERIDSIKVFGQKNVFFWPYNYDYIFTRFGKILETAGLPNNRRNKFHKIRRTTASNFEAAGGNATALLDHSHRRTTLAYLDPRVIKETHPADIVPGIGETTIESGKDDSLVDDFREFLQSRKPR
ncbi:site-specific tyrosine recombinase XerD [Novipirellula aureliae]|uniref:Site-specific tyrosine recombinase XerD n=1 Tax=Novipirellula aureliae TaxID=2527966 RepID=A0A5C6DUQ4_9BACT|nr:tyrosine-type recombinase/integrase [Novipirellula aureliae]TWU39161.1 site-specific tyrosine recombinase XerD [Novipirellula aureliae]